MKHTDSVIVEQFILRQSESAARELEKFEPNELVDFFNDTTVELFLAVIPKMNPQTVLPVFEMMQDDGVVQIFESMDLKYAELLIRMMHPSRAEGILNKLSSEKSQNIRRLLKFFKTSVGSYVEHSIFTLIENLTVKEALVQARRHKANIDPHLFVLAPDRKLRGMVTLSDLIKENPNKEIRLIMRTQITTVSPESTIQSIINHPGWKDQYLLPVVEPSMVFLGAIRLETIRTMKIDSDTNSGGHGIETINALGELYQIGLAAILKAASDVNPGPDSKKKT